MTLIESVPDMAASREAVSEPPRTIFRLEQTGPRVPNEYLSLYTYLEHRFASTVVLTFEQMEALLGFSLPRIGRAPSQTGGPPLPSLGAFRSVDGSRAKRNTESPGSDRDV